MRLGIRAKFVGIVVAAITLPVAIGIFFIWSFGYHYYVRQMGQHYEVMATHIADRQNNLMRNHIGNLEAWVAMARVPELVDYLMAETEIPPTNQTQQIDKNWATLEPSDPILEGILNNPLAEQIQFFQKRDPLFVEVLIADAQGRLIAASNKTTDYYQADEPWWQNAIKLDSAQVWVEGLHFEQSSQVYSRDIAIPIRDPYSMNSKPIGVLKGIINVTPVYTSIRPLPGSDQPQGEIILPDGHVLTAMFGQKIKPMSITIPPELNRLVQQRSSGYTIANLHSGDKEMIAWSEIDLVAPLADSHTLMNFKPTTVLIHQNARTVLAPVFRQMKMITLIGLLLLIIFATSAIYLADRHLIGPLQLMRKATDAILGRINTRGIAAGARAPREATMAHERAQKLIERVEQIRSGDELEQLAQGFGIMSRRILNYHEQLETELEERSQEYAIDLRMAREFQQAFLSREMLRSFSDNGAASLALRFDHIYKPALSIGGDFYDVKQINEHCVGVFIADVMGHGLRSALITTVMRTLLENLSPQQLRPAEMMREVNRQFYHLMPQSSAQIFATAFYLMVDVRAETVAFSSAGHFSPIILNRHEGSIEPLASDADIQPALGLLQDSIYTERSRLLKDQDLILLFTDGVTEATDINNQEYGVQRLIEVLKDNIERSAPEINRAILSSLHQHMDTVVSPDDICLITIEAVHKS